MKKIESIWAWLQPKVASIAEFVGNAMTEELASSIAATAILMALGKIARRKRCACNPKQVPASK